MQENEASKKLQMFPANVVWESFKISWEGGIVYCPSGGRFIGLEPPHCCPYMFEHAVFEGTQE